MSVTEGIILGIIQGLTEFLPVSSTGHLIVAREVFGIAAEHGLAIDAVLQLATALAVLVYFRADFLRLCRNVVGVVNPTALSDGGSTTSDRMLVKALVLGTIPAVVGGLLLEEKMETVFRSTELVAWTLIAGSILLLGAEWVLNQRKGAFLPISPGRGFAIGCFQALALIPGMSRSGATIAGGIMAGLSREAAARFAFMLSFPIILGSGLKKFIELVLDGYIYVVGVPLLISASLSFGVGMLAIHYLLRFLKHHSLGVFIVYRLILAAIILNVL